MLQGCLLVSRSPERPRRDPRRHLQEHDRRRHPAGRPRRGVKVLGDRVSDYAIAFSQTLPGGSVPADEGWGLYGRWIQTLLVRSTSLRLRSDPTSIAIEGRECNRGHTVRQ